MAARDGHIRDNLLLPVLSFEQRRSMLGDSQNRQDENARPSNINTSRIVNYTAPRSSEEYPLPSLLPGSIAEHYINSPLQPPIGTPSVLLTPSTGWPSTASLYASTETASVSGLHTGTSETFGMIPISLDCPLTRVPTNTPVIQHAHPVGITAEALTTAIKAGTTNIQEHELDAVLAKTEPLQVCKLNNPQWNSSQPHVMSQARRTAYHEEIKAKQASLLKATTADQAGKKMFRRHPELLVQAAPIFAMKHSDNDWERMYLTETPLIEAFTGALTILICSFNPEYFQMEQSTRIINIKCDSLDNLMSGIKLGLWTNPPRVNERIMQVYNENTAAGARPRVYLLFSISGSKQYCAMAEMKGTVDTQAKIEGWKGKAQCEGTIPIRFIYVKNVPFAEFTDLNNGFPTQTVLNMWNGMVFQDEVGRIVIERYVKHAFCRSVLVFVPSEGPVPHFPGGRGGKFSHNRSSGLAAHYLRFVKIKKRVGGDGDGSATPVEDGSEVGRLTDDEDGPRHWQETLAQEGSPVGKKSIFQPAEAKLSTMQSVPMDTTDKAVEAVKEGLAGLVRPHGTVNVTRLVDNAATKTTTLRKSIRSFNLCESMTPLTHEQMNEALRRGPRSPLQTGSSSFIGSHLTLASDAAHRVSVVPVPGSQSAKVPSVSTFAPQIAGLPSLPASGSHFTRIPSAPIFGPQITDLQPNRAVNSQFAKGSSSTIISDSTGATSQSARVLSTSTFTPTTTGPSSKSAKLPFTSTFAAQSTEATSQSARVPLCTSNVNTRAVPAELTTTHPSAVLPGALRYATFPPPAVWDRPPLPSPTGLYPELGRATSSQAYHPSYAPTEQLYPPFDEYALAQSDFHARSGGLLAFEERLLAAREQSSDTAHMAAPPRIFSDHGNQIAQPLQPLFSNAEQIHQQSRITRGSSTRVPDNAERTGQHSASLRSAEMFSQVPPHPYGAIGTIPPSWINRQAGLSSASHQTTTGHSMTTQSMHTSSSTGTTTGFGIRAHQADDVFEDRRYTDQSTNARPMHYTQALNNAGIHQHSYLHQDGIRPHRRDFSDDSVAPSHHINAYKTHGKRPATEEVNWQHPAVRQDISFVPESIIAPNLSLADLTTDQRATYFQLMLRKTSLEAQITSIMADATHRKTAMHGGHIISPLRARDGRILHSVSADDEDHYDEAETDFEHLRY